MGVGNSTDQQVADFKKQYQFICKKLHPIHGNIFIMQNQSEDKEYIFLKESMTNDLKYLQKSIEQRNILQQNTNLNVLKALNYQTQNAGQDSYRIIYVNEYIDRTLENEFEFRMLSQLNGEQLFSEKELNRILKSIVCGLCHLQINQRFHNNIRSDTVLINQKGETKIVDPQFCYEIQSNLEIIKQNKNVKGVYISPKQVEMLGSQINNIINDDQYKSDIFIIGCLVLNLITQDVQKIFDFNNQQLNLQELQNQLNKSKQYISQRFYDILDWILQVDEEQRPNSLELANQLEILGEINEDPSFENFIQSRALKNSKQQLSDDYSESINNIVYNRETFAQQPQLQQSQSQRQNNHIQSLQQINEKLQQSKQNQQQQNNNQQSPLNNIHNNTFSPLQTQFSQSPAIKNQNQQQLNQFNPPQFSQNIIIQQQQQQLQSQSSPVKSQYVQSQSIKFQPSPQKITSTNYMNPSPQKQIMESPNFVSVYNTKSPQKSSDNKHQNQQQQSQKSDIIQPSTSSIYQTNQTTHQNTSQSPISKNHIQSVQTYRPPPVSQLTNSNNYNINNNYLSVSQQNNPIQGSVRQINKRHTIQDEPRHKRGQKRNNQSLSPKPAPKFIVQQQQNQIIALQNENVQSRVIRSVSPIQGYTANPQNQIIQQSIINNTNTNNSPVKKLRSITPIILQSSINSSPQKQVLYKLTQINTPIKQQQQEQIKAVSVSPVSHLKNQSVQQQNNQLKQQLQQQEQLQMDNLQPQNENKKQDTNNQPQDTRKITTMVTETQGSVSPSPSTLQKNNNNNVLKHINQLPSSNIQSVQNPTTQFNKLDYIDQQVQIQRQEENIRQRIEKKHHQNIQKQQLSKIIQQQQVLKNNCNNKENNQSVQQQQHQQQQLPYQPFYSTLSPIIKIQTPVTQPNPFKTQKINEQDEKEEEDQQQDKSGSSSNINNNKIVLQCDPHQIQKFEPDSITVDYEDITQNESQIQQFKKSSQKQAQLSNKKENSLPKFDQSKHQIIRFDDIVQKNKQESQINTINDDKNNVDKIQNTAEETIQKLDTVLRSQKYQNILTDEIIEDISSTEKNQQQSQQQQQQQGTNRNISNENKIHATVKPIININPPIQQQEKQQQQDQQQSQFHAESQTLSQHSQQIPQIDLFNHKLQQQQEKQQQVLLGVEMIQSQNYEHYESQYKSQLQQSKSNSNQESKKIAQEQPQVHPVEFNNQQTIFEQNSKSQVQEQEQKQPMEINEIFQKDLDQKSENLKENNLKYKEFLNSNNLNQQYTSDAIHLRNSEENHRALNIHKSQENLSDYQVNFKIPQNAYQKVLESQQTPERNDKNTCFMHNSSLKKSPNSQLNVEQNLLNNQQIKDNDLEQIIQSVKEDLINQDQFLKSMNSSRNNNHKKHYDLPLQMQKINDPNLLQQQQKQQQKVKQNSRSNSNKHNRKQSSNYDPMSFRPYNQFNNSRCSNNNNEQSVQEYSNSFQQFQQQLQNSKEQQNIDLQQFSSVNSINNQFIPLQVKCKLNINQAKNNNDDKIQKENQENILQEEQKQNISIPEQSQKLQQQQKQYQNNDSDSQQQNQIQPQKQQQQKENENQQILQPEQEKQQKKKLKKIKETFSDGSYYCGQKLDGKRNGKGRFYYSDGGFYEGEWKDNQMHGFGVLYYPSNQKAYEGQWQCDKFHGQGIVYNDIQVNGQKNQQGFDFTNFNDITELWVKYDGFFKDDYKHGKGSLYLISGEIFVGKFEDDMINGEGKFKAIDGTIYQGIWQENKLVEIKQQTKSQQQ